MASKIIISLWLMSFPFSYSRVVRINMIPENFPPSLSDCVIISKYNIIRVQLNHLLEADNHNINIISGKIKHPFYFFLIDHLRIDHITIPCNNIGPKFFISTIFSLVKHTTDYIIFEILIRIRFLFLFS